MRWPPARSTDVRCSQAKVALKAGSEEELLELEAIAKSLNLAARSILDASVTDLYASEMRLTVTCIPVAERK